MGQVFTGLNWKRVTWKTPVIAAVGLLLVGWLLNTPGGLLGKADAVAYAVCHRIAARSFHLGERPISLCARCTGMYLGALAGLVYQHRYGRRRTGTPPRRVIGVLAGMVLAFMVDGLNSYMTLFPGFPHLYEPQNWLRLLTGTGMGIAVSVALFPAFNLTIWQQTDSRPAITNLRSLGVLLICAALVDLLVLSENPLLLYPLALVSAGGVLVLLTMVYSLIWVMLLRTENQYLHLQQLFFPLTAGFGVALLQIALLDIGRYLITGTWDGFHLG